MRKLLGAREIDLRSGRVGDLLAELAQRAGDEAVPLLFDGDRGTNVDLRVLVNGRSIQFLDGLETKLGPDEVVTLHWAGARGYPGG